jgi:hypothetical protein
MQMPGFNAEVVLAQARVKRTFRRERENGSDDGSDDGPVMVCTCVPATVLETWCIGQYCITVAVENGCAYLTDCHIEIEG